MLYYRFTNWFKDPITIIGFMNFFTMMLLTLYRGYLGIFLTEDLAVTVLVFTIIITSINIFQVFMRVPLAGFSQAVGRKPMIIIGNLFIVLAYGLLVVANHYLIAFISAIFLGIGMSAHWPATFAYIQDGRGDGRDSSNFAPGRAVYYFCPQDYRPQNLLPLLSHPRVH